jgi:phage shock protein C
VKLARNRKDCEIAGVCGGLASAWGLPSDLIRVGFIVLTLFWGGGAVLYAALALWLPEEGERRGGSWSGLIRLGEFLGELSREENLPWLGGLLVLLGLWYLTLDLGWVSLSWLWPLALIGLGLFFLVKRR